MKVLDKGHLYQLDTLLEDPENAPRAKVSTSLRFVKRVGEKYPGNVPPGYEGTTTQEVIRALIDRMLYVDAQKPHPTNDQVIRGLRTALMNLELRAAKERGEFEEFVALLAKSNKLIPSMPDLQMMGGVFRIEELPTCSHCGHIGCQRHQKKP